MTDKTLNPTTAAPAEANHGAQADEHAEALKRIAQIEARVEMLEHELDAVYASTSWRITRPMRALSDLFRALGWKNLASCSREAAGRAIRSLLRLGLKFTIQYPRLGGFVIRLARISGISGFARSILNSSVGIQENRRKPGIYFPENEQGLSPEGARVYKKLKNIPPVKF